MNLESIFFFKCSLLREIQAFFKPYDFSLRSVARIMISRLQIFQFFNTLLIIVFWVFTLWCFSKKKKLKIKTWMVKRKKGMRGAKAGLRGPESIKW